MGITMASSEVCGDPDVTVLLQRNKFPCSPKALDSFWFRGSSSTAFLGSNPKLDNTNVGNAMFLHEVTREEDMEEDAYLHPQAKKRRLTATQVHVLEKHFEVENKLDPERKIKLAKELGLQPRQVAVWFQNRRARFKTKQLEKDCSSLRSDYDQLKADYERLLIEHQNLKQQVSILKEKLAVKEIGKEDVYVDTAIKPLETGSESRIPNADYGNLPMGLSVEVKQEEASSVGSELLDSERSPNPNYIEVNQIDEQEDDLGQSFYDTSCFRNSCSFGSSLEDLPDWSWLY